MAEDICKIHMKDVRLSFPQLFRAKAFGDGSQGEPAFSAEFLIPKDTKLGKKIIDAIYDGIDEAKVKKWGADDSKWPRISKDKPFFKDGDDRDYARPESENCMIVSARNLKKPRVLGIDKEDLHESDGIIYAGCYVDAIVRIWAQDNGYGKRVNCSLEAVRFRRDGDAFGAAPIDPDEFEDIEEGEDDRRSSRSSSRGGRDRDDDRGSRRGRDEERGGREERGSRRGRDDDDDGDDRRSSRRGRDEDDGDDRGSSRRGRDRDEDDDRGSRRGRDRDDDGDDRGSSRRSSRDEDDDRSSSRRGRDDDRGSSRRGRDEDEDDRGSRSSRRGRDDDDGEDRPSRNSRSSRRGRDDDDNGI